jgi:hypothetical protein
LEYQVKFRFFQLKHEIVGETFNIPFDSLIQGNTAEVANLWLAMPEVVHFFYRAMQTYGLLF